MDSVLCTHAGAARVTRGMLRDFPPPPETATYKPVAHLEFVESITEELAARNIEIAKEQFSVARGGALLFGTMDLTYGFNTSLYGAALGLRASNDKSISLQIACGLRVFVCDNMAFSGDMIALRRKHTSGLDLPIEIKGAIERWQSGMGTMYGKMQELAHHRISDTEAKEIIFDACHEGVVPLRLMNTVADSYFDGPESGDIMLTPRTKWALHNAFTMHFNALTPARSFRANMALGRMFGLTSRN